MVVDVGNHTTHIYGDSLAASYKSIFMQKQYHLGWNILGWIMSFSQARAVDSAHGATGGDMNNTL